MKSECDHTIGTWDNVTSVIGRYISVSASDPWALDKRYRKDFEPFHFCPDCGADLTSFHEEK